VPNAQLAIGIGLLLHQASLAPGGWWTALIAANRI
jgi:hypothetical protein